MLHHTFKELEYILLTKSKAKHVYYVHFQQRNQRLVVQQDCNAIITKNNNITLRLKKKEGWHENYIFKMFAITLHSCYTKFTVVKSYSCGSITHVTHVTAYF